MIIALEEADVAQQSQFISIFDRKSGGETWFFHAPIPSTGWSLFLSIEKKLALGHVSKQFLQSIFFLVLSLLVVLAFVVLVSKRIVQPIKKLSEAAKAVTAGNMNAIIISSSHDEVGDLGHTFNEMMTSLRTAQDELNHYSETLEDQVRQRTLELEKNNEQLNQEIELRKLSEQEQQESEQKISAMSQAVKDALVMIDSKGRVAFWNQAAENLFGYRSEEALGHDFHDMAVLPEDRDMALIVCQTSA